MTIRRAACLAVVAALATGCGDDDTPVPLACTQDTGAITQALTAAPDRVRLEGGAPISACVEHATSDAELQTVGLNLSRAGEDLEERALDGDREAALRLGYLVGATRRGAARTSGISAQLVNRLERSAAEASTSSPDVLAAVQRGMAAGEANG